MKVYLIQSGYWEERKENITKVFLNEEIAWKWGLKKFGTRNLKRENIQNIKGFRGAWIGLKRWALMTEHKVNVRR